MSALEEWSVPSQALYNLCYLSSPAKVMSEPSHLSGPSCSFRQHIKELAQQHQSQQFHPSQLCWHTQMCKVCVSELRTAWRDMCAMHCPLCTAWRED